MKTEFKAIAMRCNQEQFEAIKFDLEVHGFITRTAPNFSEEFPYLLIKYDKKLRRCAKPNDEYEFIEEFDLKQLLNHLKNVAEITYDPVFIERYNITDKVKELLAECKKQGFDLSIDNGVIILKQI